MRRRWQAAWPFILGAIAPFVLAMLDKYARLPLRWPIAAANLVLCLFYLLSMLRAHRYISSVYEMAYAAHARKVRQTAADNETLREADR
ncbi:MAG TPA: hypothetical protein VHC42_09960 [Rhizomicrobium sp.]|nr:hypothetical protein [Rhizomicrobium sp.]